VGLELGNGLLVAALSALAPLVEHRRGGVGDHVRLTNRLTRPLKNDFPHVLDWFDDQDTTLCCACLAPRPTLKAAQLARRATLERFFCNHHALVSQLRVTLHALEDFDKAIVQRAQHPYDFP
jgi:hypothetical protein